MGNLRILIGVALVIIIGATTGYAFFNYKPTAAQLPTCNVIRNYFETNGLKVYDSAYHAGGLGAWSDIETTPEGLLMSAKQNDISVIFFDHSGNLIHNMFYFELGSSLYRTTC